MGNTIAPKPTGNSTPTSIANTNTCESTSHDSMPASEKLAKSLPEKSAVPQQLRALMSIIDRKQKKMLPSKEMKPSFQPSFDPINLLDISKCSEISHWPSHPFNVPENRLHSETDMKIEPASPPGSFKEIDVAVMKSRENELEHSDINSDIDFGLDIPPVLQPLSFKQKSVALMKSGGVRKNEEGQVVSYFLRQSFSECAEDAAISLYNLASGKKNDVDKLTPLVMSRHALSTSTLLHKKMLNSVYSSMEKIQSSREWKQQEMEFSQYAKKFISPGERQRSRNNVQAYLTGKVGHGWNYEQIKQKDGTYAIKSNKLYVSKKLKKIGNTALPTRHVELYEFSHQSAERNTSLPGALKKMEVFLPEEKTVVSAHSVGNITKITTVDCYELGERYLLYRAPSSSKSGESPAAKRKLVIQAHGAIRRESFWEGPSKANIPHGITIAFIAPDQFIALVPSSLVISKNIPPYSRHEVTGDGIHKVNILGNPQSQADADGGSDGKINDLVFEKSGSMMHDAATPAMKFSSALANVNEGAAWAAHDRGEDILVLRQHVKAPLHHKKFVNIPVLDVKNQGGLQDVMDELTKHGLLVEYDQIFVVACRGDIIEAAPPVYGTAINFRKTREE